MKKLVLASAALLASAFGASAADMAVKSAPYVAPAPIYNWTGFYIGGVGTAGMLFSEHADQWCDVTCSTPVESRWGGGFGGTAGFNFQSGRVLYGIEGDISWVDFKTNHNVVFTPAQGGGLNIGAKWDWYATLRGRMGLVVDDTLAYVTGGVAWVGTKYHGAYYDRFGAFNGGFPDVNGTRFGIAAGAGVEHKFTPNWSLKAEYLFIGLESVKSGPYLDRVQIGIPTPDDVMTHRSSAHLLRVGLNYTFGAYGPGVVAKY